MQKPSVGRIVHYVSYGTPGGEFAPEHRAAIITATDPNQHSSFVALCVINPTGLFFHTNVPGDEDTKRGGTWHWPEREA